MYGNGTANEQRQAVLQLADDHQERGWCQRGDGVGYCFPRQVWQHVFRQQRPQRLLHIHPHKVFQLHAVHAGAVLLQRIRKRPHPHQPVHQRPEFRLQRGVKPVVPSRRRRAAGASAACSPGPGSRASGSPADVVVVIVVVV